MLRLLALAGLYLSVLLLFAPHHVEAFGAGNIASIAKVEGKNFRHGDIEDMLKTVAFIQGHKWTSLMIKRAYFGNWLRDYSQAIDVGTLKGVQSGSIRILVWILSFMAFGYATEEFEVTDERLGVYRPEEHGDNPNFYSENVDARAFDSRLRPPVDPIEIAVDPKTGMKNYIANEDLGIANSAGYVKFSLRNCIHFGRLYTNGTGSLRGCEADLCEALRYLGQALHCLEDFPAHSNYVELVLLELGFHEVFPHTGTATQINLHGRQVFPVTTGTFGGVDFLHSLLGEATDHVTQSEVDVMAKAMDSASEQYQTGNPHARTRNEFVDLLQQFSRLTGVDDLCTEAIRLQRQADADYQSPRAQYPSQQRFDGGYQVSNVYDAPPPPYTQTGSVNFPPTASSNETQQPQQAPQIDVQATVNKIYPILAFRDRVARTINGFIEKIPGLESLIENISEHITLFIMSLLAPYIKPVIAAATKQLKVGSSEVISASAAQQYAVWDIPTCSDPTHSLLSKDHFSNILNTPAGQVASCILKYVAPRVFYAWENPGVPVEQVLDDCVRVFHHPAIRAPQCEIQQQMFQTIIKWVESLPHKGANLNHLLGAQSIRNGTNHKINHQHDGVASHTGHPQHTSSQHSIDVQSSASPLAILNHSLGGFVSQFTAPNGRQRDFGENLDVETRPAGGYASSLQHAGPFTADYRAGREEEHQHTSYSSQLGGYGENTMEGYQGQRF